MKITHSNKHYFGYTFNSISKICYLSLASWKVKTYSFPFIIFVDIMGSDNPFRPQISLSYHILSIIGLFLLFWKLQSLIIIRNQLFFVIDFIIMGDQTEDISPAPNAISTNRKPAPIKFDMEPNECFSEENVLTVDTMRPRANTAPSTPSRTTLPLFDELPQITIEDFSTLQSPTGNANTNSGAGLGFALGRPKVPNSFFSMDCRPRSRTCPEDLFRKSFKRPPTPPPTPCSKLLDFGKSRKPRYSALKKGFGFNKDTVNNFALKELPEIGNDLGEFAEKDEEEVDEEIGGLRDDLSATHIQDVYESVDTGTESDNFLMADLDSSTFACSNFIRRGSSWIQVFFFFLPFINILSVFSLLLFLI